MEDSFQHLIDNLSHPDPAERVAALDAIGQWEALHDDPGRARGALAAVSRALDDPDRDVRWAAAYALGAIGDPAGAPPLLDALRRPEADGDTGLRLVIVKALGKTGAPGAVPALEAILRNDELRCMQAVAVRALARIEGGLTPFRDAGGVSPSPSPFDGEGEVERTDRRSAARQGVRPLRIGIDCTAALHQSAGIGRYVRELVRALADQQPDADVRLFAAEARPADLPAPPGGFRFCPSPLSERTHARLWQRLRLPIPVEWWTGPLDVFHATDFALPPTRPGTRTVLTVPDLAFEHYPEETMPGMLAYLRRVVPRSARRADHVIAISEATRADLIALYGLPPEKISAVPLGVDPRFGPGADAGEGAALRARCGLPDAPFILTVGTLQPRKNHARLVRAFAGLAGEAALVIAGGRGWAYDEVQQEVERLGLAGRVIFTGFVDETDLPALYRAAALLAYPALYEGFGLPVLEAMACGLPVITSRVSSLPEVAGDAALLVDPLDEAALAAALARLLRDGDLRAGLRERGLKRAAGFTWARTARETAAIYARLAGSLQKE